MTEPTFDADGYPSDETLERIKTWPMEEGWHALMAFVQEAWTYHDAFTRTGNEYAISTLGWSGNEELIGALSENTMFWMCCWVSSRRGGHYEFEVREPDTVAQSAAPPPSHIPHLSSRPITTSASTIRRHSQG